MNFADFHFLRPWWLLGLPLGLFLLQRKLRQGQGRNQWLQVCDRHLLDRLLVGENPKGLKRRLSGLLLMLLLAVPALAGPTWERLPLPLFHPTTGRVIVLDLSLSMRVQDLKPSRLERARYLLTDLIKGGAGQEQGLVIFAGDAFIVTPLTDDRNTLLNLLPGLTTDTPPVQGSRADRGLEEAENLLQRSAVRGGRIILITDDADQRTIHTAARLRAAGHRIEVIAVGSPQGAPIPLNEGGFLKDNNGLIVVPVPDFQSLQATARAGGGRYFTLEQAEKSLDELNHEETKWTENHKQSEQFGEQWRDYGPWLLLPLLLLASLCFRKGWLMLLLLGLSGLAARDSAAADRQSLWLNLWQRPEQQAAQAFAENDWAAVDKFSQLPQWRAAALYRAGKFKEAAAALETLDSSRDHYNRGNALAQLGAYEQALEAYDQALATEPQFADARFNRDLVKRLLQEPQTPSAEPPEEQPAEQKTPADQESLNQPDSEASSGQENRPQQKTPHQEQAESSSEQNQLPADASASSSTDPNRSSSNLNPAADEPTPSEAPQKAAEKTEPDPTVTPQEETGTTPKAEATENASKTLAAAPEDEENPLDARQQALEQWLRRVPDDPGGLLRKKFLYQYQDREKRSRDQRNY